MGHFPWWKFLYTANLWRQKPTIIHNNARASNWFLFCSDELWLRPTSWKQSHRAEISTPAFWMRGDPSDEPPATADLTSKKWWCLVNPELLQWTYSPTRCCCCQSGRGTAAGDRCQRSLSKGANTQGHIRKHQWRIWRPACDFPSPTFGHFSVPTFMS